MRGLLLGLLFVCALAGQTAERRSFRIEELRTPRGFRVEVFARVSGGPRHMAFGPNGVLYVAARDTGRIVAAPGQDRVVTVLSGLNGPHSLAFRGNDLLVAVNDGVLLVRDAVTESLVAGSRPERVLSIPAGGQHSTRTVGIGPDGRLYVAAGSSCNFCNETDRRRAAVTRYEADGSGETLFSVGLRNTVGFAWNPVNQELWGVDNGGDGLGDNDPPEELNVLVQGGDYGWPDCIGDRRAVSWGPAARPGRCDQTRGPELEMPAHSAPLGIAFYAGDQFPASFVNHALVALHGSWNRRDPAGYKVIRIRTSEGRATGSEDFLWGFLDSAGRTRSGRPVHALPGPDGAVYVSDDDADQVYRVSYNGPRINPGGIVRVVEGIYELYGSNLGGLTRVAANGVEAEILYAGEQQVNFRLPPGLPDDVTIEVETGNGSDSAPLPPTAGAS